MRFNFKLSILPILVVAVTLGFSACASSGKKASAPAAEKAGTATEAKKDGNAGTVEVKQSPDELARQQQEEQDRVREAEIERMKKEEAGRNGGKSELASTSAISPTSTNIGLGTIYFDFDKYDVSATARETLAKNAETVKANSGVKVVVEGHCDERGTAEYNLALGERRSTSAKKYLVSLGVDESRLYTISYGEEKPADAGHNEVAWSKNRRVQFSEE